MSSGEYEIRFTSYVSLAAAEPVDLPPPSLRRWFQYETETDCEILDWDDRANREWGWP